MRRMTTVLLLSAMLLSMAACGNADTAEDTAAETDAAQTDIAVETGETRPMHQVPETDHEGANFHIAYPEWQGYRYYFFADEATGDAMNDAIFDRTIQVEEYLNVDITQYSPGYIADVVAEAKKAITAGDDVYSLVLLHCINGVSELATNGMLYNFDDLPVVDLDADWWNRDMMDVLRLGKRTAYGVSDYMIPCPYAVYFNKDIVEDYGMEDPYQLVYEGNWTLDTMVDMAVEFTRDVNGDGVHDKDNDNYGISAPEASKYISFVTGCNQFLTEKNADGKLQLALNTEKTYSIVETLHKLVENPGTVYTPTAEDESAQFDFNSGRLLFRLDTIAGAVVFREYEADIGILPYPKFDAEQENYVSLDWGGLMAIPATIQDSEMVGSVLELLSWFSEETVIPAYYDVLLDGKLARDEDTRAMVDILFDTIAYEVGCNYSAIGGGISDLLYMPSNLVLTQKSTDFASFYAKYEKGATAALEKLYASLESLEG
ncbi:MAG: extracellular solute-binding protein [Clostridia bacterium]|nr:extracellular solute-binding protein [Clostridia bacterium]